ncbi:MAG: caspase family protein [Polaribacter sp.]|uniref:caspase family protein n=1 Tax=Polaribacter sp. TaxID=1920175 RepID=UPI003BB0CFB2
MNILKNITFLLLFIQFSTFSQNYVFEENFDGTTSWPEGNNEIRELKIYNGRYYFDHKEMDNNWQVSSPTSRLNTTEDFEIETSIQKISGTDNSAISFLFDYKDAQNYREFGFSTNGYYRISESINGNYSTIQAWTKSDKVKTGNYGVNVLKVRKKGNTVTFLVNDDFLYSMDYRVFLGDKYAITLYKNQKISIDYIRAQQLSSSNNNNLITTNKTILFEGFNNNDNNWAMKNSPEVSFEMRSGDYVLDHKRDKGGWNSTIEKKIDTQRDFSIIGQFKKISGINNNGFGLLFGRENNDNQHEFFITSGGSFKIKEVANGKANYLKNWTKSSYIQTGNNAINYLNVTKEGNTLKYYINSNLVHTSYSFKFYGDRTGFIVYDRQRISVGYLSIMYSDNNTNNININNNNNNLDVILSDDFYSNINNWSTSNNETVNFSFSNGNYNLEHKIDEKGWLTHIDKYFDTSKDFEIETKFEHIFGNTNAPYGILWGKKDTNYFQFLITATGYYKINRVVNNKSEDIVKWVKSATINEGSGKSNIVKIEKDGDFYKFYINNTYITKIDFEPFYGTGIGYGVYYKQKISVDYLTIKNVKTNNYKPIVNTKTLTAPLYDSFDSNINDWNLEDATNYSVDMSNGQLILARKTKGGIFISRDLDIDTNKDFILETAISEKNTSDGMYGFTFGRKNSANEFTFLLSGNGSYKYRKFENDTYSEIIPLTSSSAIKTGENQANKIKIVKSGKLLRFYINDQYVNETAFENFFGNKIGYTIYFDRKIAADYLDVKYQTISYNDPPTVVITEPTVEQERGFKIVEAKRILVKGRATDADGIFEITVNGIEANVSSDGTFTANVPLKYGKNDLIVKATDLKQASSTKTFVIKRSSPNIDKEDFTENTIEEKIDIGFGKYYALIIGVSKYTDTTIADLQDEPTKDAQSLADVLTAKYSFAKENVTVLKNPTENEINREFIKLSRTVGANDNLVIFYAGHGNYDKVSEKGYWMPSNANMEFEENIILNTSIVTYIKAIPSKHTLLISDACFSGSILTRTRSYEKASNAVKAKYALPSRKAITSGALETVPNKSVFMEYLIKRLNNNTDLYLSAGQLFNMIEDPVINNPVGDKIQRPIYAPISRTGDEGGDFIFIKRN